MGNPFNSCFRNVVRVNLRCATIFPAAPRALVWKQVSAQPPRGRYMMNLGKFQLPDLPPRRWSPPGSLVAYTLLPCSLSSPGIGQTTTIKQADGHDKVRWRTEPGTASSDWIFNGEQVTVIRVEGDWLRVSWKGQRARCKLSIALPPTHLCQHHGLHQG